MTTQTFRRFVMRITGARLKQNSDDVGTCHSGGRGGVGREIAGLYRTPRNLCACFRNLSNLFGGSEWASEAFGQLRPS